MKKRRTFFVDILTNHNTNGDEDLKQFSFDVIRKTVERVDVKQWTD